VATATPKHTHIKRKEVKSRQIEKTVNYQTTQSRFHISIIKQKLLSRIDSNQFRFYSQSGKEKRHIRLYGYAVWWCRELLYLAV